MKTNEKLLENTLNTIGWKESDNRAEFKKGAQVAISKCEDHYEQLIKNLISNRDFYKNAFNNTRKDIKGFIDFIKTYEDMELED